MLGFGAQDVTLEKTTESPYVADMSVLSNIYVYCDIVEPQIVGDINVQLLKNVHSRGRKFW